MEINGKMAEQDTGMVVQLQECLKRLAVLDEITSPKINAEVIEIDTVAGCVKISVGFEGGL